MRVVTSSRRLLEVVLALVVAAAGVGFALDSQLSPGLALAAVALMLAWWRFRLPPP